MTIPPTPRTKYRPPVPVGRLVERKRLMDALERGRDRRLTLIHAPAGFGKTTLAAQWRDRLTVENRAVAWMGIDPDDNEPVWLLAHLIEAIGSIRPGLTEDLIEALEQHADEAARHVLPVLLNKIDQAGEPLVVVIDDWHRVTDPRAAAGIEFLLEHASPLLQFVVVSRSRTGLPLAGLQVRDQLVEVDGSALRFDPVESEQLLVEINGLPLADSEIADLQATTDGWVAALQLASLSLRSEPDTPQLIRSLSGRHHSMDAYLAENVLDRLPAEVLDFLLLTALPERLCADLVTTLTRQPHGQAMLEQIEAADLFLHPLDQDRVWFRYHHLFVDFLRRRLRRDHPEQVAALHRKSAAWFASKQLTSEAVDHALAAGEPELAVRFVADQAAVLFEQSRLATLQALADKLPRALAADSPRLQIALGWTNCLLQRGEQALASLAEAERALRRGADADEAGTLALEGRLLRGSIDLYQDRMQGVDELIADYLDEAETLRPWLVVVAANIETVMSLHRFDFTSAISRQVWAQRFNERVNGPLSSVLGWVLAANAALERLDVRGAQKHLLRALEPGQQVSDRRSYAAQLATAQLGALQYHLGNLDTAAQHLTEAAETREGGLTDFLVPMYVIPARLSVLRRDDAAAEDLLAQGATVAHDLGLDRLAAAVFEEQARLDFPSADEPPVVPERTGSAQDGITISIEDHVDTARILRGVHAGSVRTARRLIPDARDLLARTEARNRPLAALRARVLLVSILFRADLTREAEENLVPALRASARTGLISPISDGGAPIAELLTAMTSAARTSGHRRGIDGLPPEFVARVHHRADTWMGTGAGSTARLDPRKIMLRNQFQLTGREQEILRLLDAGRSNQEIAHSLNLSTNTVKWYLKTLYQKLDVTRRQECVAAARSASLLP